MTRHDNVFLNDTTQIYSFRSAPKHGAELKIPVRKDLIGHKNKLLQQFQKAQDQFKQYTPQQVAAMQYNKGTYVEFSGAENYELLVHSLEDSRQGIKSLPGQQFLFHKGRNRFLLKKLKHLHQNERKMVSQKIMI